MFIIIDDWVYDKGEEGLDNDTTTNGRVVDDDNEPTNEDEEVEPEEECTATVGSKGTRDDANGECTVDEGCKEFCRAIRTFNGAGGRTRRSKGTVEEEEDNDVDRVVGGSCWWSDRVSVLYGSKDKGPDELSIVLTVIE